MEETWVSGSVFSLPQVVRSIDVQYLPHPHRDTSPQSIVLINQSHSEVKLKQMNNRQNLKPDLLGEPKLRLFLQKCHTRGRVCGDIDHEANQKRVKSGGSIS